MMKNDHDRMASGAIIPFQPRAIDKDTIEVSTIVALVAVTILHSPDEGPEDKLVEMIEQSGEAEIIEVMDAFDDTIDGGVAPLPKIKLPANDN